MIKTGGAYILFSCQNLNIVDTSSGALLVLELLHLRPPLAV